MEMYKPAQISTLNFVQKIVFHFFYLEKFPFYIAKRCKIIYNRRVCSRKACRDISTGRQYYFCRPHPAFFAGAAPVSIITQKSKRNNRTHRIFFSSSAFRDLCRRSLPPVRPVNGGIFGMGIHVLGTGSYTPEFQVTNDDMAKNRRNQRRVDPDTHRHRHTPYFGWRADLVHGRSGSQACH